MKDFLKRIVNFPRLATLGLQIGAVVLALAFSIGLLVVVLLLYGTDPVEVIGVVGNYALIPEGWVAIINKATTYYLAGLAAALGFRMGLFNIGIDGQYRLGVLAAAVVGASVELPSVLHIALMIAVSCLVGAAFALIAGYLKSHRGVSEVISTIMLNSIATGIIAYLLAPALFGANEEGSNNVQTELIPESGWMPSIPFGDAGNVYGFMLIAIVVGVGYWMLTERTKFGFDLAVSGASPRAAQLAGTDPKKMILYTMIISGAVAGLVGLPELLGSTHRYGISFPSGLAWTGFSVAIIGRNHPIGVAFGAILWAFLERAALPFDMIGVPKEVVVVVQASVVLSVVVAYELVFQFSARAERRRSARFARAASAASVTSEPKVET